MHLRRRKLRKLWRWREVKLSVSKKLVFFVFKVFEVEGLGIFHDGDRKGETSYGIDFLFLEINPGK